MKAKKYDVYTLLNVCMHVVHVRVHMIQGVHSRHFCEKGPSKNKKHSVEVSQWDSSLLLKGPTLQVVFVECRASTIYLCMFPSFSLSHALPNLVH